MNETEKTMMEITEIIGYLKCLLDFSDRLVGFSSSKYILDSDIKESKGIFNDEAIQELTVMARKISSKSDILQNKVQQLANLNKN